MNKCLILAKPKETEEKHNAGLWFLVDATEEAQLIEMLGSKFIFSFSLNEIDDETLLRNF